MSEEASLRDLVDRLPDDPLNNAVKSKVAGLNKQMQDLVAQYKKIQSENRDLTIKVERAEGEKESLRKKLKEQLASIKANVEAMEQSKREPTGYTAIWAYGSELMVRVFDGDRDEAYDFWDAIGDVPKVFCEAEITNDYNVNTLKTEQFLRMQQEKLTSRLAALGFEQEVVIPDEVEETLRLAREFIDAVEAEPGHTPHHVMANELKGRLDEMLIDDEEPGAAHGAPGYPIDDDKEEVQNGQG